MTLPKSSISGECPQCRGTGTEDFTTIENSLPIPGTRICTMCNGETRISNSSLSEDLINQFNDMQDKINDIFEKVNE